MKQKDHQMDNDQDFRDLNEQIDSVGNGCIVAIIAVVILIAYALL